MCTHSFLLVGLFGSTIDIHVLTVFVGVAVQTTELIPPLYGRTSSERNVGEGQLACYMDSSLCIAPFCTVV